MGHEKETPGIYNIKWIIENMKPVPKLIFSVFLLILISSGIWLWIWLKSNSPGNSTSLPAYATLSDFSLVDQNNDPINLKTFSGKIWIADFIFTRCAGPCPILSARMQRLQGMLSHVPQVVLVSFSVDPEYDTPEVLARYAERFGIASDRWSFVTGGKTDLDRISREFKLTGSEHPVFHSLSFVLVDGQGQIRGYYDSSEAEAMQRLQSDARTLMNTAKREAQRG